MERTESGAETLDLAILVNNPESGSVSRFAFSSRLPAARHAELADLMFSNVEQHRVRAGIVNSIERYGVPEIIERGDSLGFSVGKLPEVQTLFALDGGEDGGTLAGVMIHAREDHKLVLLHIGVDPIYSATGAEGDALLVLQLIDRLRAIARSIQGIETVEMMYGAKGVVALRA